MDLSTPIPQEVSRSIKIIKNYESEIKFFVAHLSSKEK